MIINLVLLEMYIYTKNTSTDAMAAKASKLQVPLRLADESDDELVNALFRSGKWKDHRDAQRVTHAQCACVMFRWGVY